jgi:hypothetical protein
MAGEKTIGSSAMFASAQSGTLKGKKLLQWARASYFRRVLMIVKRKRRTYRLEIRTW